MNYPPILLSKTQRSFGSRVCQKCLIYGSLWMFFGFTANAQVLPKEKSISDKKGRTIEGVILGIEADQIVFKKANDDKELKIPRSSISEEDQKYLRDLEKFISEDVGLDFITIGNPGNENDSKAGQTFNGDEKDPKTGNTFGKVDYVYEIGKQAVTNAQYAKFLNAKAKTDPYGLYDERMNNYEFPPGSQPTNGIIRIGDKGNYQYSVLPDFAQEPVNWIHWFRAARFCNWMANGQGDSDTENGAYTLNGKSEGIVPLNDNAKVRLPTENEWYKATYYNPITSTYSVFVGGDLVPKQKESTSFYGVIYQQRGERLNDIVKILQGRFHREYNATRVGFNSSDMRDYGTTNSLCNVGGRSMAFRVVRTKVDSSTP